MRYTQLTVEEAAARLGVTPRRVRAMIASGRLSAEKRAGRYLVGRLALEVAVTRGRTAERPLAARSAWALLALLSGQDAPALIPRSTAHRVRRLLISNPAGVVDKLAHAQPRSVVHRWRVLPADIARLIDDVRLTRTGLAAKDPAIAIRHQPERDGLDAYTDHDTAAALRAELLPDEHAASPNLTLRVPVHAGPPFQAGRAPTAVVAADLLDHPDARVRRTAQDALRRLAHAD